MKNQILPGLQDLPIDEYHAGPGISKSNLDLIRKAPAAYKHWLETRDPQDAAPPTAAQRIGSALHTAVLEPKDFSHRYTRELQRDDRPHAIDEREKLVEMIDQLNESRLPKLSVSGDKQSMVDRILEFVPGTDPGTIASLKMSDLKALLEAENTRRPGLLLKSGSRHDLAELLRANGVAVQLWSDEKAAWEEKNAGKVILTDAEWEAVDGMSEAIHQHPAACALLEKPGAKMEVSAYWTDVGSGVFCRCRPDCWIADHGLVLDLKTTEDASPEGFARSCLKYRYHVQAAMYLDGLNLCSAQAGLQLPKQKHFAFIAVEKKPPYLVAVYVLDADSLELGRQEYQQDLHTYAACLAQDTWPGYAERVTTLSLPEWHLKKHLSNED